jgi:hypothetical protein
MDRGVQLDASHMSPDLFVFPEVGHHDLAVDETSDNTDDGVLVLVLSEEFLCAAYTNKSLKNKE